MMGTDDELFPDLEGIFDDVDENDYENLALLEDLQLLEKYRLVIEELKDREELYADGGPMFGSSTQEGRDLHSKRAAYLIEIRRRGLPI